MYSCRDITIEFGEAVKKLGDTFMELVSEAMGLNPNHLKEMDGAEEVLLLTHYYPPCPEPELAIGINKHADSDTFTILLQDHIGGLQVLHNDLWYDVPHIPGALVINGGDLLQASFLHHSYLGRILVKTAVQTPNSCLPFF